MNNTHDLLFAPEKLNTSGFQIPGAVTRALVVLNPGEANVQGRVQFAARFPVREGAYPKPVTVRKDDGGVVPSRFVRSVIESDTGLEPGKVWWDTILEFVVDDVPARGWRTWGASFEQWGDSREEDGEFWEKKAGPLLPLPVVETECHDGTLPPCFAPATDRLALPDPRYNAG